MIKKENVTRLIDNFYPLLFFFVFILANRIKMLKSYETWTDIFCFTIHISNNMNDKIELYQNYTPILMFSLTIWLVFKYIYKYIDLSIGVISLQYSLSTVF